MMRELDLKSHHQAITASVLEGIFLIIPIVTFVHCTIILLIKQGQCRSITEVTFSSNNLNTSKAMINFASWLNSTFNLQI